MFHLVRQLGASVALAFSIAVAGARAQIATTTLTTSANPIGVSLPLTLTAEVSPAPPSGKVTFYDRTTVLATGTLDATGKASVSTIALLPGGHQLKARFWAGNGCSFSESPYVVQEIWSAPSKGFTLGQTGRFIGGGAANNTIATADFNGDGQTDFAVGLQTEGIAVYLGNGDGTFQAPTRYAGIGVGSLAAGDLRGTGRQDIVAVTSAPSSLPGPHVTYIQRYWNNGDGTFQRGPDLPVPQTPGACYAPGCAAIQIADMNGDGRPDLVYLSTGSPSGSVSVFLGNGDGTFQNPITAAVGSEVVLAYLGIADFNRDGKPDVTFLGSNGSSDSTPIIVMLGNGDGTLQAPISLANDYAPSSPLVTGDFNRDGNPDIAVSAYTAGSWSIEVLLGNGDGSFQAPLMTPLGFSIQEGSLTAADINGDSVPDLITASGQNVVSYLYGNGDGTFQAPAMLNDPFPAKDLAVADLNHDGHMDLVALQGTDPFSFLNVWLGSDTATEPFTGCFVAPGTSGAMSGAQPAQTLYVGTWSDIFVYSLGATSPKLTISEGVTGLTEMVIDKAGRIYASNFGEPLTFYANSSVTEYLPGETTPVLTRTNGASQATGVAVDDCGNVYASEYYKGAVSIYQAGQVNPFMQLNIGTPPQLLATHGDELFVAENLSVPGTQGRIAVYPTGSVLTISAPGPLPENSLTSVGPFVVDHDGSVYAAGDVISADVGFEEFVDVFAPGSTSPRTSVVVSTGRNAAFMPFVFVAGTNLYVAAPDINTVFQYQIGSTLKLVRTIIYGLNQPGPMAVDAQQNLYVLNVGGVTVYPPGETMPSQVIALPVLGDSATLPVAMAIR